MNLQTTTAADSNEVLGKKLSDCNLHLIFAEDKEITLKADNECLVRECVDLQRRGA